MGETGKRHKCAVCGISSSTRVFNKRHGENCNTFIKNNANRGTIEGFSNYWINLNTGVLRNNKGALLSTNINNRGNRVINLTHDDGSRKKFNLDREWMKLKVSMEDNLDEVDTIRLLTAENRALKAAISSDIGKILIIYYNDLCVRTRDRSVLLWTNFIMMSDPTLNRDTVKKVITTIKTGVDSPW